MKIRILGAGRAGTSLARALKAVGHEVDGPWTRGRDLHAAAHGVDALVIATADGAIERVAAKIEPDPTCVVLHLSGSLGLEVLGAHRRTGAMHPLVPLPTAELGARRLRSGITFAVAGDEVVTRIVESLGGTAVHVADQDRAIYHAAACVAANHVVALLGQVERLAAEAGLPLEAFLGLTRAALDDVEALGPRSALTGPAARGDWNTIERHLAALPEAERASYQAGVAMALELAAPAVHEPAAAALAEPVDEDLSVRAPVHELA
jgi:predicted short-subunit dehydrogenase-like oxidoreductase (DUF2520 family)